MEKIEELLKANKLDEALDICNNEVEIDAKNIHALLYCGKIYNKKGDFKNAMNYFLKVLAIDPENVVARASRDMIKGINDYFCKDMINP